MRAAAVLLAAILAGCAARQPESAPEAVERAEVQGVVSDEEREQQATWVEYMCSLPLDLREIVRREVDTTYHASCPDDPRPE